MTRRCGKKRRGRSQTWWLKHCSRICRVAAFWSPAERKAKLAMSLVIVVTTGRLHFAFLAQEGRKATLTEVVDPCDSVVGKTLHDVLMLLKHWTEESRWSMVKYMGDDAWLINQENMLFARRLGVQMSCGIFRRLEQPFSTDIYRLQWIISPNVGEELQEDVAHNAFTRRACCCSEALRRFRAFVGNKDQLTTNRGKVQVRCLEDSLSFSNHPVEQEHKIFGDLSESATSGSAHAHASFNLVCQRVRVQHQKKVGTDPRKEVEPSFRPGEATYGVTYAGLDKPRKDYFKNVGLGVADDEPNTDVDDHNSPPAVQPGGLRSTLLAWADRDVDEEFWFSSI